MTNKKQIYIIFYSTYGHVLKMAEEVKKGVDAIDGAYQVPETLPEDVLEKMHAAPKSSHPIIKVEDLPKADGFVFGMPTRFGLMPAQMKAFFDATGGHWQAGALAGKPASLFFSTASQGGGQETTAMTTVTTLTHHGMIFVPAGYAAGGGLYDVEVARGGSAWGAGTLAGPTGARQPSEIELLQAKKLGEQLATVAKKLAA